MTEPRPLTPAESDEIRGLGRSITERERQIGQLTIEALAIEGRRSQVLQQLYADHERRNVRVRDFAIAHGIDPSGSQKWHLDTSTSELAFQPTGL